MLRTRVFWRLGSWTAERIVLIYVAGIRGDSDRLAGTRKFARGKKTPLSLLLSVPTDVYRLRSAPTGPRVIAVAHGDSRLVASPARPIDLSIYRAIQIFARRILRIF